MFILCSRLNYGPQKKWVQPKNFKKWPKIILLLGFSDFWWFQSTSEPQKPPSRHLRHKNRPKNTKVTDIQPLKKDFGHRVSQPNLFVAKQIAIREHQNPFFKGWITVILVFLQFQSHLSIAEKIHIWARISTLNCFSWV